MSEELAEIVEKVAEKTGLVICLKDANEVLKYTVRKCEVSGKGTDYVPVLFENELRDFLTRKIINARGAIADVFDIAVNRTVPDEELELGAEVSILEKQVGECVITGQEDYERASDFLREIKGMQTKVKEYWEPLRVITKQAYDNILAKKKEMMTPLEKAETILKRKMGDFANEQERIKREREEAVHEGKPEADMGRWPRGGPVPHSDAMGKVTCYFWR